MAMYQGIDLSRFKKTGGDAKSSTLRHAKGHEIKIAHHGLSPEMRDQIAKMPIYMAEGHEVPPPLGATASPMIQAAPEAQPTPVNGGLQDKPQQPVAPPNEFPVTDEPMTEQKTEMPPAQPYTVAQKMKAEDAAWQNDLVNGHITPETYKSLFEKKDTLGKIGTLFGMLVSGAGSGLSHQPNAVFAMMQKEIDNDLDAQKASKVNAHNFLRLSQEHELQQAQIAKMGKEGELIGAQTDLAKIDAITRGDYNQANIDKLEAEGKLTKEQANIARIDSATRGQKNKADIKKTGAETRLIGSQSHLAGSEANAKDYALARARATRAAFHSLVLKMNKLPQGSPIRQQYEKQLGILFQSMNNENSNLFDRAAAADALGGAAFGTPGQSGGNPEEAFQQQQSMLRMGGMAPIAEDKVARHMPGVSGAASVPLTSGDREDINNKMAFQQQLQRFIDFAKKHSDKPEAMDPRLRNEAEILAKQLQGSFRMATKGGVYKEGEQGFISSIIDDDPLKFFNKIRVQPKLKALQDESSHELDQLLKSKGFKGYEGMPKKKEPGNGTAQGKVDVQFSGRKLINGTYYKKVPGGWQKEK